MMAKQAGFTLIEVMVAIMLMAIVSIIAWRGLDSVNRSANYLESSAQQQQALLQALYQLQRDLALRASSELSESQYTEDTQAALRHTQIALSVAATASNPLRLELVRSAPDRSTLQRIRWWINDGTLYRAAAQPRNRYPLPAPEKGVALLDKLQNVQVQVWRNEQRWAPLSGHTIKNPKGLVLSFTRRTAQGDEYYRQVFALDEGN
jgi:general secretion pathway protein J